ncbi:MAG: cation-transporting P-type ATPase, partial [Carnobacterium sp.]
MKPYKETEDTVISGFNADLENGLSQSQVDEKIKNNGRNKFEEPPK